VKTSDHLDFQKKIIKKRTDLMFLCIVMASMLNKMPFVVTLLEKEIEKPCFKPRLNTQTLV
jgi:hypothetical protein